MTELERIRRQADASIPHARTCKKSIDECPACRRAVAFYAGLPLPILALVTEERPIYKPAQS